MNFWMCDAKKMALPDEWRKPYMYTSLKLFWWKRVMKNFSAFSHARMHVKREEHALAKTKSFSIQIGKRAKIFHAHASEKFSAPRTQKILLFLYASMTSWQRYIFFSEKIILQLELISRRTFQLCLILFSGKTKVALFSSRRKKKNNSKHMRHGFCLRNFSNISNTRKSFLISICTDIPDIFIRSLWFPSEYDCEEILILCDFT